MHESCVEGAFENLHRTSSVKSNLPVNKPLSLQISATLANIQRTQQKILHRKSAGSLGLRSALPEEVLEVPTGQQFQDYEPEKTMNLHNAGWLVHAVRAERRYDGWYDGCQILIH